MRGNVLIEKGKGKKTTLTMREGFQNEVATRGRGKKEKRGGDCAFHGSAPSLMKGKRQGEKGGVSRR